MVFPLSRHNLSIGTGDLDSSVQAGLVVSFYDVTAVDLSGTNPAVVRTLGTGEAIRRPAIRTTVETEKSVFLLQTKPQLVLGIRFH